LIFDEGQTTAECSCGRWALAETRQPLTLHEAKSNHGLHVAMVTTPAAHPALSVTIDAESCSTFPTDLMPLRDRLIREAQSHPAFDGMNAQDIARSVEHRLFGYIHTQPWWFRRLAIDKPKRQATEAQRHALEVARQAKVEKQRESEEQLNERLNTHAGAVSATAAGATLAQESPALIGPDEPGPHRLDA
jgi:hypothetical protein